MGISLEIPATALDNLNDNRKPMKARLFDTMAPRTNTGDDSGSYHVAGFRPDSLAFRPLPRHKLATIKPQEIHPQSPESHRSLFYDLAYPWSTIGRITTGSWIASGVLVGPRHVLMASHSVPWTPDGHSFDWIDFSPMYNYGPSPLGTSSAVGLYARRRVSPNPGIYPDPDTIYDYAVMILADRLGDTCGWMGSRGYRKDWNNGSYWYNAGYAGVPELALAQEAYLQSGFSASEGDRDGLDSIDYPKAQTIELYCEGDEGQSGSPIFGFWGNDPHPSVVGVYATLAKTVESYCPAGDEIAELIKQALSDDP